MFKWLGLIYSIYKFWLISCLNSVQMFKEITFVRLVCLINGALNKQEIAVNIIFYAPKFLRHKSLERPYMVLHTWKVCDLFFFFTKFPGSFHVIFIPFSAFLPYLILIYQ